MTLLVLFSDGLEPYFCLGEKTEVKIREIYFESNLLKNIFWRFRRQIHYNRKSHSKIHAFFIDLSANHQFSIGFRQFE